MKEEEQPKKLTKNELLYGTNVVPKVPEDLISERVKLLDAHLAALLSIPSSEREYERVRRVVNAIDFWNNINRDF